jgi:hypothetical protein
MAEKKGRVAGKYHFRAQSIHELWRGQESNISKLRYFVCMGEDSGVHTVLVGKTEEKRPLGRPRRRWEDNNKMDLQEVGGVVGAG